MQTSYIKTAKVLPWIVANASHTGDECLFLEPYTLGWKTVRVNGVNRTVMSVMCEAAHGNKPHPKSRARTICGHAKNGCLNPNHIRWELLS